MLSNSRIDGVVFPGAFITMSVLTYHNSSSNIMRLLNPLSDDNTLDWSKLKQIADDILKCI